MYRSAFDMLVNSNVDVIAFIFSGMIEWCSGIKDKRSEFYMYIV